MDDKDKTQLSSSSQPPKDEVPPAKDVTSHVSDGVPVTESQTFWENDDE